MDAVPVDLTEKYCTTCKRLIEKNSTTAVYGTAVAFCDERHYRRWVRRVDKEDRLKRQGL